MIYPVHDNLPDARRTAAVCTLLWINFGAFVVLFIGFIVTEREYEVYELLGLTPLALTRTLDGDLRALPTLVTYMFLHAGFIHIIANLFFLNLYGKRVEDRLGSVRFVILYILAGIAGGLLETMLSPASTIPIVGASGAISGVMGAYLLLVPHARLECVYFLLFVLHRSDWPAWGFVLFWFFCQLVMSVSDASSIAWFAHIGGFVAGLLVCPVLKPRGTRLFLPAEETNQKSAWIAERRRMPSAPTGQEDLEVAWRASLLRGDSPAKDELARRTFRLALGLTAPFDHPMFLNREDPAMDDELRELSRILHEAYGPSALDEADSMSDHNRLNGDRADAAIWDRLRRLTVELRGDLGLAGGGNQT